MEQVAPIVLNQHGEKLIVDPSATEDNLMSGGKHAVCGGDMSVRDISKTHKALTCKECGSRTVYPNTVETIRDFREHMQVLQ